jgi:hypothetical protein
LHDYNAAAHAARLAFFDVAKEPNAFRSPPRSLTNMFNTSYYHSGARTFLLSFTDSDVVWWDRSDDSTGKLQALQREPLVFGGMRPI